MFILAVGVAPAMVILPDAPPNSPGTSPGVEDGPDDDAATVGSTGCSVDATPIVEGELPVYEDAALANPVVDTPINEYGDVKREDRSVSGYIIELTWLTLFT